MAPQRRLWSSLYLISPAGLYPTLWSSSIISLWILVAFADTASSALVSLAHAAAGASTQSTQVLQSYLALHTEVVSVLEAKAAPRLSHSGVLPICLFLEAAGVVDLKWSMVLITIVFSHLAIGVGPFRVWDVSGILGGGVTGCVAWVG